MGSVPSRYSMTSTLASKPLTSEKAATSMLSISSR